MIDPNPYFSFQSIGFSPMALLLTKISYGCNSELDIYFALLMDL